MWWNAMHWNDGMGFGWGAFGLMHVLWWVLLVGGIVWLVRSVGGGPRHDGAPREDRAQAILRERYARGEIDQADFDERMRRLKA